MFDEAPKISKTTTGQVQVFLTANKFRVILDDGQIVDAVMTDELIEKIRPIYESRPNPGVQRIFVTVEFRDPPAMHVIIKAEGGSYTGGGATPFRG